MAKDTDSVSLTDQQKTRLLKLALGPPASPELRNEDDERADLLYDILRCSLPPQDALRGGAHKATTGLCHSLRSVTGPPIGELLQDPQTSLAVLRTLKQYAKARGNDAASGCEKDVFLAIYFAAIVAALLYHGTRITEHTDVNLARFFTSFVASAWVCSDLREFFQNAAAHCQQRVQTDAQ